MGKRALLLSEMRRIRSLTYDQLSERSGVSSKRLNEVERGDSRPSPEDVRRIAQALEVDAEEVYELRVAHK